MIFFLKKGARQSSGAGKSPAFFSTWPRIGADRSRAVRIVYEVRQRTAAERILDERHGRIEAEIVELERERANSERELADYRSTLAWVG